MEDENNLFVQTDKLKKQAEAIVAILAAEGVFGDSGPLNTVDNFVQTLIHWKRGYFDGEKFVWSGNYNIFLRIYMELGNVSTDGTITTVQPQIHKVEVTANPVPLDYVNYEAIHREVNYELGLDPWA